MPEITLPSTTGQQGNDDKSSKNGGIKAKNDSRTDQTSSQQSSKDAVKDNNPPKSQQNSSQKDEYASVEPKRDVSPENNYRDSNNNVTPKSYNRSDQVDDQVPNYNPPKTRKNPRRPQKSASREPFSTPQRGSKGANPDPWADPWGDDPWGGDDFNDGGGARPKKSKMTPQERVSMIEEVYQHVLGRKPDTRDINYYKYSTLTAEEIKSQLLEGKEHSQLLEDGREYKKMKERAEQAEIRVKTLEGQIKDQLDEFKQLTTLLKEKNNLIQQLRAQLNNPYGFSKSANQRIEEYTKNNSEHYSIEDTSQQVPTLSEPTPTYEQPNQSLENKYPETPPNTSEQNSAPRAPQYVAEQPQLDTNQTEENPTFGYQRENSSSESPLLSESQSIPEGSEQPGPTNLQSNTFGTDDPSTDYQAQNQFQAAKPVNEPVPVRTTVEIDSPQIESVDDAFDTLKDVTKDVTEKSTETVQSTYEKGKSKVGSEINRVEDSFRERKIVPPVQDTNQVSAPTTVGSPQPVDGTNFKSTNQNSSDIGSVIFSSSLPPKEEPQEKKDGEGGIKDRIRGALSL